MARIWLWLVALCVAVSGVAKPNAGHDFGTGEIIVTGTRASLTEVLLYLPYSVTVVPRPR